MLHIGRCIQDLLKKSGKKQPLEHAAVWVPDSSASVCMNCHKSQFNVLNRRVSYLHFITVLTIGGTYFNDSTNLRLLSWLILSSDTNKSKFQETNLCKSKKLSV